MKSRSRNNLVQRRRWRIRKKVHGTAERPRLVVTFTNKHIHAQCINDDEGKTLVGLSTAGKDLKGEAFRPNMQGAAELGKILGDKAKSIGIESVVFDRAGRRYHGTVKALADAARESGLKF